MTRSRQLAVVVTLVVSLALGVALAINLRDDGWRTGAEFTGAATAGHSVSPDARWDLKLVWLEERDSDGSPRVQLHLTDRVAFRHFRRTVTITDPEVDTVDMSGRQRIHWIDDDYGTVALGTVRIGSEVVKLPE